VEFLRGLGATVDEWMGWIADYRARLAAETAADTERAQRMNRVNPKFVLRNHLAESAIADARGDHGPADFSEVARLLRVLQRPYDEQDGSEAYAQPPRPDAAPVCVSCSS